MMEAEARRYANVRQGARPVTQGRRHTAAPPGGPEAGRAGAAERSATAVLRIWEPGALGGALLRLRGLICSLSQQRKHGGEARPHTHREGNRGGGAGAGELAGLGDSRRQRVRHDGRDRAVLTAQPQCRSGATGRNHEREQSTLVCDTNLASTSRGTVPRQSRLLLPFSTSDSEPQGQAHPLARCTHVQHPPSTEGR